MKFNKTNLTDLIEYLKALAELKKAGHHTTLEITQTVDLIEQQIHG